MEIILTVALPIFALIFVGYGAGRWRALTPEGIAGINGFVYAFALPVMLFDKLSATPIARVLDGPFITAYLLADAFVFGLAYAVTRRGLKQPGGEAAQQAMGAAYGNTGYLGLPIAQAAAGRAAAIPMAVCMSLDMLFLMPLTLMLVGARGQRLGWRQAVAPALRGLLSNPMMIGILLGVGVSAIGLPMPAGVRSFTALLGAAAGPCALFAIGATLAGRQERGRPGGASAPEGEGVIVALVCGVKLVVHPLVTWGLMAGVFSIDPLWTAVAILAASLPVASTVYVVAGRYRVAEHTVSSAILVSTALSVVTVSLVLFLLFGTG